MTTSPLVLATVSLLAVCAPTTSPDEPPLEDRVFLSQSVTENDVARLLVGVEHLTLRFWESPRLGASAGCNSLDATYAITDGKLVVSNAGWTEIGCEPDLHAQDDWYFGFLQSSPAITVDGDTLVLDGGGIHIEYLDKEVATPDFELVGPLWTVDTIVDGEAASHADWPAPATLRFEADGAVTVATGCNGGSGTYAVAGTELTFTEVGVTEEGCPDELSQSLETAVLGIVHGPQPVTFEIDWDRLSLRNAEGGVDLVGTTD